MLTLWAIIAAFMDIDAFIDSFHLPFSTFPKPIKWQDGFGFSVLEQDSSNKYASLYKIGIHDKGENSRKSLWASVSYGEISDSGVILGSVKSIYAPIDLDFRDEFFYDIETGKFYYHENEIDPKDILVKIRTVHKRPTEKLKGFPLRVRLWWWRRVIPWIVRWVDNILVSVLLFISGDETKKDSIYLPLIQKTEERIEEKKVEFKPGEIMTFFGYTAKKRSVVFYCTLHLLLYCTAILFSIKHGFWTQLFQNNFLALCYIVVSFSITNDLLPTQIKKAINKLIPSVYGRISFKRLNISL